MSTIMRLHDLVNQPYQVSYKLLNHFLIPSRVPNFIAFDYDPLAVMCLLRITLKQRNK